MLGGRPWVESAVNCSETCCTAASSLSNRSSFGFVIC